MTRETPTIYVCITCKRQSTPDGAQDCGTLTALCC